MIVLTNSATFAGTAESAQQLAITRIRAIESSRQIVSVSTVGISALIDQNGHVLSQTDENVAQILYGSVAFSDAKSLANRLGGWATPLVLGLSCVLAWVYRKRR
jgi:apolipoprotein N-acyltransferase